MPELIGRVQIVTTAGDGMPPEAVSEIWCCDNWLWLFTVFVAEDAPLHPSMMTVRGTRRVVVVSISGTVAQLDVY